MIPSTLMLMRMQGKYSSMLHHLLSFVTEAFFDLVEATRGRTSGGVGPMLRLLSRRLMAASWFCRPSCSCRNAPPSTGALEKQGPAFLMKFFFQKKFILGIGANYTQPRVQNRACTSRF